MIQAMTTGHEGSMSTGHANSPADMLRRLETMILMTGYELPMRAIREQIASAVDLIVHTARLRDGSRKIVEHHRGLRGRGRPDPDPGDLHVPPDRLPRRPRHRPARADRHPPDVHAALRAQGGRAAARRVRHPAPRTRRSRAARARHAGRSASTAQGTDGSRVRRSGEAGSRRPAAWSTSRRSDPIDLRTGEVKSTDITEQTRQCLRNLRTRLEASGSSLDDVVWANWSLREPSDYDAFNEEWLRWFPGEGPIGQGTLLPLPHRRAGFRVSIGVIAAGTGERTSAPPLGRARPDVPARPLATAAATAPGPRSRAGRAP